MRYIVIAFLTALPLMANDETQVCLLIDQRDTGHEKYPNIATVVDDFQNSFEVFHKKEACFDLEKNYYLQYFLSESAGNVIYGTRCIYELKLEDAGKVLRFEGNNGETPCPVVDEYHIDF